MNSSYGDDPPIFGLMLLFNEIISNFPSRREGEGQSLELLLPAASSKTNPCFLQRQGQSAIFFSHFAGLFLSTSARFFPFAVFFPSCSIIKINGQDLESCLGDNGYFPSSPVFLNLAGKFWELEVYTSLSLRLGNTLQPLTLFSSSTLLGSFRLFIDPQIFNN